MPARKRPQGISYHKWRYATDPEFRKKLADRAHAWQRAHPERRAAHGRNYDLRSNQVSDARLAASTLKLHWGGELTWEEAGASIVPVTLVADPMFTVVDSNANRRKEYIGLLERELREWETHGVTKQ
jgi:hypothetical protein